MFSLFFTSTTRSESLSLLHTRLSLPGAQGKAFASIDSTCAYGSKHAMFQVIHAILMVPYNGSINPHETEFMTTQGQGNPGLGRLILKMTHRSAVW
jgi:hypothetical protein